MLFVAVKQSSKETRTWTIGFSKDLPTGVTVSSATGTHTGPSTESLTIADDNVDDVTVTLATPGIGIHYVEIVATLSNNDTSQALLRVEVEF